MKAVTLLFIIISNVSISQITTFTIPENTSINVVEKKYDSLRNFLQNEPELYVGQELYVTGEKIENRRYHYKNFIKDYKKNGYGPSNIYKRETNIVSSYDSLVGKYFKVLSLKKYSFMGLDKPNPDIFLEIEEKNSGDTLYYVYDSKYEDNFPFLVTGYFVKQKELLIGRSYVMRTDREYKDINTGALVAVDSGSKWKIVDLGIDDKEYKLSIIFENQSNNKISLPVSIFSHNYFTFSSEDNEKYKKKFGDLKWKKVLKKEVEIGFTEEMVKLSWGDPDKINDASYGDQWVYKGRYLYFEKGILKAYN